MSSVVKSVCCLCIVIFSVSAKTYIGNPSDYLQKRDSLQAGDSLVLESGDYTSGFGLTGIRDNRF